jgi:hypothetical protein
LPILAIVVLLAALPEAIQRLIQTGNSYLFTDQFFQDMMARLSGPGRFRFVLQPLVAILLGARDGKKDARAGEAPFLWKPAKSSLLGDKDAALHLDQLARFGLGRTDYLGHTDAEIVGGDGARLMAIKQRVMRSGVGNHTETTVTFQSETHYYDLTVEPLRDALGLLYVLLVLLRM